MQARLEALQQALAPYPWAYSLTVLAGLLHSPFENLLGFTEVLQDGMLELIRAGKMSKASATSISVLPGPKKRRVHEGVNAGSKKGSPEMWSQW